MIWIFKAIVIAISYLLTVVAVIPLTMASLVLWELEWFKHDSMCDTNIYKVLLNKMESIWKSK